MSKNVNNSTLKPVNKFFIASIKFYRRHISGLKPTATCRFIPTCSQYGIDAFTGYGIIRGFILTAWRILRCNPLCKGGFDPIPKSFLKRKLNPDASYYSYYQDNNYD